MDTGYFFPPNAPIYHGTFVAGIIGAAGNNAKGIAGLNWSVQIMAIRFYGGDILDPRDYSLTPNWSDAVAAWDYVLMMCQRDFHQRSDQHRDSAWQCDQHRLVPSI